MVKRVVHHYAAAAGQPAEYDVPVGTRILGAGQRPNGPHVYVEKIIESQQIEKTVKMKVLFVGTGRQFEDWDLDYVGTIQAAPFIWHVFAKVIY